ncbi:MAG: hypothetical protein LUC51_04375 [Cloacibacillus porcorum]|nr:hypothetical protein [Cloacibacillus porcorum]
MIRCWRRRVTELPAEVADNLSEAGRCGRYFYPYWLLDLEVSVKFPFIAPRRERLFLAVDAVNSGAGFPPPEGVYETEAAAEEVVTPRISKEELDGARISQMIRFGMRKRARAWSDIGYAVSDIGLVYKENLLWRVRFLNGTESGVSLDTFTGEYGIIPIREGIKER